MHILVEVATTKVRTFWTEVEKVFMPIVFRHELFGPKETAKVITPRGLAGTGQLMRSHPV